MVKGVGTRVFYVTTGGFDTHSGQNVNVAGGSYYIVGWRRRKGRRATVRGR